MFSKKIVVGAIIGFFLILGWAILAQSQVQIGLIIREPFEADAWFVTWEVYEFDGVLYSTHNPILIEMSSDSDLDFVISGDIQFVQTWELWSGVNLQTGVVLLSGDGLKEFKIYFYNKTGIIQETASDPFEVFIDQTSPSEFWLLVPINSGEAHGSVNFEREVSVDTGVGHRDYTFMISSDTGFNNIVFVDTVVFSGYTTNVNALGNGEYFWKVICYDKLGNATESTFWSFVVDVPVDVWSPSPGGWWNGWDHRPTIYDYCPQWDFSPSYYDGECSASEWMQDHEEEESQCYVSNEEERGEWITQEVYLAFQFAKAYGIANGGTMQEDDLFSPLLRKEAAKIFSQFAINVIWLEPTVNTGCGFDDIDQESYELQSFMITACELGIMWVTTYGEPDVSFNPNELFRRTHFVTVLSRLLRWNRYNGGEVWYANHLDALSKADIVHVIDSPWLPELRIFTYIMLARTDHFGYVDDSANRESIAWRK